MHEAQFWSILPFKLSKHERILAYKNKPIFNMINKLQSDAIIVPIISINYQTKT